VSAAHTAFARKLYFQHNEIKVGIPLALANGSVDYDRFRGAIHDTQKLIKAEDFRTIVEIRFTPDMSEEMIGPGTGGPTCYIELAVPLGEYSKGRIVSVYQLFEDLMRERYDARPHLGKKTSFTFAQMQSIYGTVWDEFQAVRQVMDPGDRFIPPQNKFLRRIFKP
jgi:hypothetical protein